MIWGDDMRSPVERSLGPGEPLAVYASNSAPPDPARSEEHGLKTTADRVDEHDRLRKPVIQHDLNPAIKIEGYLVPSSLAAPAIPEPYWLAAPSRSMAGILVDFGSAAVVAAVVTLFATGQVPTLWNIGASGKAEQRSGDASTRAARIKQTRIVSPSAIPVERHCDTPQTRSQNGGFARIRRCNGSTAP